jgi:beta-mannosidase
MPSTHCAIAPTQWEYRLDSSTPPTLDGILNAEDQERISQWSPCSQFPTEIHLELMKAGSIPHPYKQRNEHKVQWVGKQHWEFRGTLNVGSELSEYNVCELDFEGLDTFVTVFLNDKEILTGDNHFLPYKVCHCDADFGDCFHEIRY